MLSGLLLLGMAGKTFVLKRFGSDESLQEFDDLASLASCDVLRRELCPAFCFGFSGIILIDQC